jgi:hypothetical protein
LQVSFNLLVREISIASQIEKRAIAAGEGYHSSLEALDAERSELRQDLLEAQHALSEVQSSSALLFAPVIS